MHFALGVVSIRRIVLIFALLLYGAAGAPAAASGGADGDVAGVRAVMDAFAAHFRALDSSALASIFTDPAVFDDPHRGEAQFSAASLVEMFRADFANIQEVRRYELVASSVHIDGETAAAEATYAVDMTIFELDDAFQITYGWSLRKIGSAWRIHRLWVIDMQR